MTTHTKAKVRTISKLENEDNFKESSITYSIHWNSKDSQITTKIIKKSNMDYLEASIIPKSVWLHAILSIFVMMCTCFTDFTYVMSTDRRGCRVTAHSHFIITDAIIHIIDELRTKFFDDPCIMQSAFHILISVNHYNNDEIILIIIMTVVMKMMMPMMQIMMSIVMMITTIMMMMKMMIMKMVMKVMMMM